MNGVFAVAGTPDGETDNTGAAFDAINAARAYGSGLVLYGPGTWRVDPLPLYDHIHYWGAGHGTTMLKLNDGVNGDLFSASTDLINLAAPFGTGDPGGVSAFSLGRMTLDGNKAAQTALSYALRFYGYGFILYNLRVLGSYSDGVLMDWNGGINTQTYQIDNLEAQITNVKIHDCGGVGLRMGGPHDSQISNLIIGDTGAHGLHFGPNAQAMQVTNAHAYSSTHGTNSVAYLIEAGTCHFMNCEAEGSDVCQVVMLGNGSSWRGGRIFSKAQPASGIQLGQLAGQTPYPGQVLQSGGLTTAAMLSGCDVDTHIDSCEGPNGSIWLANDGGNVVRVNAYNQTGPYLSGARNVATQLALYGRGLTSDGTLAKGGGVIESGCALQGGTLAVQKSSTTAALVNGATIATLGVGMAMVTSSAACSGLRLQTGSKDGQECKVVNAGAYALTFDVPAVSHVADGTSSVIPPQTMRLFIWDTVSGHWFRSA